jgi:hypothetical protein
MYTWGSAKYPKLNTNSIFNKTTQPVANSFYLEGILLNGNVLPEGSLKVEYAISNPYDFNDDSPDD